MLYISWDKTSKIFEPKLINQLNWQNHNLFLHQNHYQAESATWHFYSQNKKLLNHTEFKAQIVLFGGPSNPSTIRLLQDRYPQPIGWTQQGRQKWPICVPCKFGHLTQVCLWGKNPCSSHTRWPSPGYVCWFIFAQIIAVTSEREIYIYISIMNHSRIYLPDKHG